MRECRLGCLCSNCSFVHPFIPSDNLRPLLHRYTMVAAQKVADITSDQSKSAHMHVPIGEFDTSYHALGDLPAPSRAETCSNAKIVHTMRDLLSTEEAVADASQWYFFDLIAVRVLVSALSTIFRSGPRI